MTAAGVYNIPKKPAGPALEKMSQRIRPSATVGIPIRVVKKPLTMDLPRKFFMVKSIAMGVPQSMASIVAKPEKRRERKTTLYSVGSPENISCKAFAIPSIN